MRSNQQLETAVQKLGELSALTVKEWSLVVKDEIESRCTAAGGMVTPQQAADAVADWLAEEGHVPVDRGRKRGRAARA
jgi:hypothetical protein